MHFMNLTCHGRPGMLLSTIASASVVLLCQTGCTSALTTAYLRDALWEGLEHAAEATSTATAGDEASPADAAAVPTTVADDIATDRADADRRRAAIEEAIERLSRVGTLDAAAQATLVETLQATQQEDWPVVIEAFSATLAEAEPPAKPAAEQSVPAAVDPPAAPTPPIPDVAVVPEPAAAPEPVGEPQVPPAATAPVEPAVAAPEPPAEAAALLAVRNACFASRVQAWGVVERFATDRFTAGQEVIVYFELDGLAAGESAAGFTTCIDTSLRLVSADGRELHAWKFEPVAETCVARRRDYFARYVVRLPAAAGECRVEIAVTDTLAGKTATATVPCVVE